MTTLVFGHDGWDVATNAWSVGSERPARLKREDNVVVCYAWGSSGGIETTRLQIKMSDFLKRIAQGGVVDLRDVRAEP
jgi:hypothetical protein